MEKVSKVNCDRVKDDPTHKPYRCDDNYAVLVEIWIEDDKIVYWIQLVELVVFSYIMITTIK